MPHVFVVVVHLHGCVSSFLVVPAPTLTNIFLYLSGCISAPNITNVIRVNSTSVRVTLQRPESGYQCIASYTVQTQDGNSNTVDVSNSSVTEVSVPLDGLANICLNRNIITAFASGLGIPVGEVSRPFSSGRNGKLIQLLLSYFH